MEKSSKGLLFLILPFLVLFCIVGGSLYYDIAESKKIKQKALQEQTYTIYNNYTTEELLGDYYCFLPGSELPIYIASLQVLYKNMEEERDTYIRLMQSFLSQLQEQEKLNRKLNNKIKSIKRSKWR